MTGDAAVAARSEIHHALVLEHLHTYFLFPFALDKQAIQSDHPQAWPRKSRWIDGLDAWIAGETGRLASHGFAGLGPWRRASYSSFDLDSPAYADMLFFHPIVRRVFFDTKIGDHTSDEENQLRCYTIAIDPPARLWFEGSDALGRGGRAQVTDLKLYLSAQGIGVLSIGIEAAEIELGQALWINRRLRKLYPLDADSVREARTPDWLALRLERGSKAETVCEERFAGQAMVGFYPPLPNTVKSLLYFADYSQEEYEPVHDENMLVYSYAEVDRSAASAEISYADFGSLADDFLYLGHKHGEPEQHLSGSATVLIGFTNHSCSLLRINSGSERSPGEGKRALSSAAFASEELPTVRLFHTRYYLMAVVALFYRAVLLDFSERAALASGRLLHDQQSGRLTLPSITMVNDMRTEFLNFNSYWHFDDLSTKQLDNDLFRRLCCEYRIAEMKEVLANELRYMAEFVYNFYQLRTTEAVNRLAVLSLIFGGGAVLTGFFGMNFEREFGQIFFAGEGPVASLLHYFMVALVCTFVFGSLALGTFVVLRNWRDYLAFLNPPKNASFSSSLKRDR